MGAGKLRRQEVDVIFHRTHHRVHHRLAGVAAFADIPREFLDPLKVNDGHHAHQQIHMAGNVMLRRHHAAVQPFIKQHIRGFRQRLPGGKGSRHLVPGDRLIVGVEVFP